MPEIAWYFQRFDWWSVLDIFLVTLTFYWLLRLVRGTQAEQLLRGTVVLILAMVLAANLLPFQAFGWFLTINPTNHYIFQSCKLKERFYDLECPCDTLSTYLIAREPPNTITIEYYSASSRC